MAETQAMIQQAVGSAAAAAQTLRAVGAPKSSGFAEANKTIQTPKEFGSAISSEDAASWTGFAFSFRQRLCFADEGYPADLQYVEEHGDSLVNFKDTTEGRASKSRSTNLHAILSGVLRNRPLKVLRQVQDNGLEVWRQLHNLFTPRTEVRSMAILSSVMGFPNFVKEKSLIEQVANLERLADECRKASEKDVSEDILLTTLGRVLPKQMQQHIQLGITDSSTFQKVKDKVLAYERVSASWLRDRVLLECGATSLGTVTSYASAAGSGPSPMQVNMVSKRKGKKGKVTKKKVRQKEKVPVTGKGKGKNPDKGKGKGQGQKGQQKGYGGGYNFGQPQQRAKLDPNVCAYCGKTGHWAKECRKKMADQQQQQVRLVGYDGNDSRQDTARSTTGSVSAGAVSQAVRLVQLAPHVEDLTAHSCPISPAGSPASTRVVSSVFDMSSRC